MFCIKCGAQLREDARFCPKCGTGMEEEPLEPVTAEVPVRTVVPPAGTPVAVKEAPVKVKKTRKSHKGVVVFCIVLVAIVALTGTAAYLYFSSPVHEMIELLEEGKYERAVQRYNHDVDGDRLQELMAKPALNHFVSGLPDALVNEEMTYSEINECLDALMECKNRDIRTMVEEMADTLEEVNQSEQAYARAEDYYEQGNYALAMENYAQVTKASPSYQDALAKMGDCQTKYKEDVLAKTEGASTRREYESGLALLEISRGILPEDPDITQRYQDMHAAYLTLVKQETMAEANAQVEKQDYLGALNTLKMGLAIVSDDGDLTAMVTSTEKAYADGMIAEADALVEQGKYDAALARLETAMTKLPGNDSLSARYAEVLETKPVKLSELKITESGYLGTQITEGIVEDTIGNTYSPGNLFEIGRSDGYITYYLGREYDTLRMTIAVADSTKVDYSTVLAIYGETDTALYTSQSLTRTTVPFEVEVDVSDLEWLTLHTHGGYPITLYLIEPVLYK